MFLDHDVYNVFPILPPSLKDIRLGGFEHLDIFRMAYFGVVYDSVFQKLKSSCISVS